jgi:mannose-6-phosphate isomerase-like protein (cupin superfamily)
MDYMHDNVIYPLGPGDSLFFDAEATHGPEEILEKPVRFFSITANSS